MIKKSYMVCYKYDSENYGTGDGHYTFDNFGKVKTDDIGRLTQMAQNDLKEHFKDETEYFSIVFTNIIKM